MTLLTAKHSNPLEGGPSYSIGHRLFRILWRVSWLLFAAWTPAPLHRWRITLLRIFGATIHPTAHVYGSVRIWYPPNLIMRAHSCLAAQANCYCMAPILLEEYALVSQRAHLCAGTHDIEDPHFQLKTRPIKIGARAWIAAEAFVGPGVTVGEGAVLGARACAFRDLDAYTVYIGNPATALRQRRLRFSTTEGNTA